MNIFVDENIPLMTIRVLREMGHDVRDIRGTEDEGMTDDALWEVVQREVVIDHNKQRVYVAS